jgi:acyl-CoA thioesterase
MMQPTFSTDALLPPGRLLRHPADLAGAELSTLHGFGGVHGGFLVGALTSHFAAQVEDRSLRYVTAQFHRPASGAVELESAEPDIGRSLTRVSGRATDSGRELMTATAAFGSSLDGATGLPTTAAPMPSVAPPEACEVFSIPVDFVPFARYTEIRPTSASRPFAGGSEPTLTAWIRLVEDDAAPDAFRLVTLLDALAPSYAAVLDQPVPIPTVELSVRISAALERATSPWILLRATTLSHDGGWIDERIDTWTPSGDHVGAANQVRLVRA